MTSILSYERDSNGRRPMWDSLLGRYRWLTAEETATAETAERTHQAGEATRIAARRAEINALRTSDPEAYAAMHTPHPMNVNRTSYGRAVTRDDGTTVNWPSPLP